MQSCVRAWGEGRMVWCGMECGMVIQEKAGLRQTLSLPTSPPPLTAI